MKVSVSDQKLFNSDPDYAFYFNSDPEPGTFFPFKKQKKRQEH